MAGRSARTRSARTRAAPVSVPPVKVALSSSSVFPGSCAETFEAASRLGYDGVEVMVWTDPVSQEITALAALAHEYGVPVLSIHAPTLLITQRVWGPPWDKVERSALMARELGADTVVIHPPFRWQREYAGDFVEGVRERTDRLGVAIAVENMYPWRAGTREVVAYAPGWDPTEHDYDHVTLDLSHTATAGSDAMVMAAQLGEKLRHVHLADGSGSGRDEHLVPGHGGQPCGELLDYLAEQNWSGTVVAEVNTRRTRSIAERDMRLAETLAFARLHLAAPATTSR